jgi:hypothetical protein
MMSGEAITEIRRIRPGSRKISLEITPSIFGDVQSKQTSTGRMIITVARSAVTTLPMVVESELFVVLRSRSSHSLKWRRKM